MRDYGHFNPETTDILLLTHPDMKDSIVEKLQPLGFTFHMWCLNIQTLFDAAAARLHIFKFPNIGAYDKILYLDTDILVSSNINLIFDLPIERGTIYAGKNMTLSSPYHGSQFYANPPEVDLSQPAFCTGILLFRNCPALHTLFESTVKFIHEDIVVKRNPIPGCLEQPYLVYMSAIKRMYDVDLLDTYVVQGRPDHVDKNVVLYHFMGDLGSSYHKRRRMDDFLQTISVFNESV